MADLTEGAAPARFIDLHSHTDESDGSLPPEALVRLAKSSGLDALAITDHDTFAGFEKAASFAREAGLDLVRGIELNSRLKMGDEAERSAHLLGYFPWGEPSCEMMGFLDRQRQERRERNQRLAAVLRSRGVDVTAEEVEARGKSLAGRVHFAQLLVEKGYAESSNDAFRRYLGEAAPTYVHRESLTTEEAIRTVRRAGGIPVLAHPVRLGLLREAEREVFLRLRRAGLMGLEIYHSEHSPALQAHYRQLAEELALLPTGGSDFHGAIKPTINLGTGLQGNVRVPREFLDRMRSAAAKA
ncbi:MAG: PHP domain-containing protein [Acidobacteriaceae bacterium]|nr:PHP domain-containing protein [Acidobacteriaceae bacterium]